jgi:peptide/nickel transport system permease protein
LTPTKGLFHNDITVYFNAFDEDITSMGNKLALAGLVIIGVLVATALLAPFLAPYDPLAIDLKGELEGPRAGHPLGQDKLGRDILSQIIYGTQVSLAVGLVVVGISLLIGVALGAMAGYWGGVFDAFLMRIVDILLAFPGILLAIALAGILGPSLKNNVFAPVIVEATFGLAGVILAESSLSFLGLGPQDVPTWGRLLNEGAHYLLFAPHVATFPGIAIMLTVLGFNFIGDGLRNKWDVKRTA